MSTLHELKQGLHHAWDTLADGWQHLYRSANQAITRFTSGDEPAEQDKQALSVRSAGWGLLAAELFDDDDEIVVRLEAPGMERADFDLQVNDDVLVVRGQKQFEQARNQGRYHIRECAYGRFERAIALPDEVEADQATAEYKQGVLRVTLPKSAASRTRTIEVQVK